MFGIGAPEFFAVVIIAIIVLGPDRVPVAFRALGRAVRRLRTMTREFREEFADEFQFLYEEVDVLRKEAADTRAELQNIRRELSETVQETSDELSSVRDELGAEVGAVTSGVQQAISIDGLSKKVTEEGGHSPTSPHQATVEPLSTADAMAQAITETFDTNGTGEAALGRLPSEDTRISTVTTDSDSLVDELDESQARLTAFAPDVGNLMDISTEPEAIGHRMPMSVTQPPEASSQLQDSAASVDKVQQPSMHNQLGGFLRLVVMRQLEQDSEFRQEAARTLKTQAQLDADRTEEMAGTNLDDLVDAWTQQRRQLVPHGTVVHHSTSSGPSTIELFECPYGLKPGDAHPTCDASNVYDLEYFKQLGVEASYTQRMSDGAAHCQLLIASGKDSDTGDRPDHSEVAPVDQTDGTRAPAPQ